MGRIIPYSPEKMEQGERYRKSLGLTELVSLGVGGTIGSGIFVVPGIAAGILGPSSLLAWIIVAVSASCVLLSLAWLLQRAGFRESFYSLFSRVFGEHVSVVLIILYLVAGILGIGTIAAGIGQYLSFFGISGILFLELFIIGVFCAINLIGITLSGITENILTALKVIPLVVIAVLLLPAIELENLVPLVPITATTLISTVLVVYWPFTGFEISAIPVEEMKEPRTVPLALVIVMLIVSGIYLLLNIALIGSVGSAVLAASPAPIATAAGFVFSRSGSIVAVIGIIAMLSALNAYLVGASRVLHSTAVTRHISCLKGLNPRGTPTIPLFLISLLSAGALLISNNFERLAVLSVLATLVPYLFFCIAAFIVIPEIPKRIIAFTGIASSGGLLLLSFIL
jgi:amino acid transporter